jgi:4-oxalocrotonate tautomerase family enzyme
MPVVVIKLWEGRTEDQKEKIMKGVTNVLTDVLDRTHSLNRVRLRNTEIQLGDRRQSDH